MQTRRNSQPSADAGVEIVTGPNLKEAYRKVHLMYGDDALILDTRTVTMRTANGLGQEKMVEITLGRTRSGKPIVRPIAGQAQERRTLGTAVGSASVDEAARQTAIAAELDRIDDLVAEISKDLQEAGLGRDTTAAEIGLGSALTKAGASKETIIRLAQRYEAECHRDFADEPQARQWLARQIPAADCSWDGFFGCHAFLGHSRPQRLELVLNTCARFQELERRTLLLVLLPDNEGTVRRLQVEAARFGYDAAIIRDPDQLQRCRVHFDQYDAVILELPDLDHPVMSDSTVVHDWLAGNAGFHRHLVVPLDYDLDVVADLGVQGRHWNCDWVAISRPGRFKRMGKILDILEKMPLPVSLTASRAADRTEVAIARSCDLLATILPEVRTEVMAAICDGNGSGKGE